MGKLKNFIDNPKIEDDNVSRCKAVIQVYTLVTD